MRISVVLGLRDGREVINVIGRAGNNIEKTEWNRG